MLSTSRSSLGFKLARLARLARLAHLARSTRSTPLAVAALTLVAASAHAVTVSEIGDAGQTLATAQITSTGAGPLTNIFGSLSGATDADLFLINISNPASFSVSTDNAVTGNIDTQLFLFSAAGAPLFTNDDAGSGLSFLSTLPAGTVASLPAGVYYLGISLSGYNPTNINAQLLFADGLSTDVRGAAAGLQPATLGAWADGAFAANGGYDIRLTGAVAAVVPEPTTSLMFLAAGAVAALGAARRSRASRVVTAA
jgi:PEP-CTERM motif